MIIGLSGYAGSGKTTIGQQLVITGGYRRKKFAAPLKDMLRTFLGAQGVTPAHVEQMIEGDLKEVPTAYLNGATPRHAMQTLGTDWGRALLCENLWCDAAMRDVHIGDRVVFDDVRFQNEADAVRAQGGIVMRLTRPGVDRNSGHASENLPWADADVLNDRTPAEIADIITSLVLPSC